MKIILQNNEEDCLLACYTMLLNDLGINIPLYEVYTKDSLPADGLNLSYLLKRGSMLILIICIKSTKKVGEE